MDFTNVTKALTARGFKVSSFETAKEAAEYLNSQIDGATVGFGGSITLEELGLYALLSGGVILGAFFMATDYVTTPITGTGKLIFGLGCAVLTFVIREFANMPEGCSFSILLMNLLTPYIDKLTMTHPFGAKPAVKKEAK